MIGGQIVDILGEGKEMTLDELKYMHKNKTGALIKAAILAGAVLGGASEDDIRKLDEFGEKLGLAFQIKDDILDVVGDEKKLGKKVHVDAEHDKNNYITFYGIDKCKKICSDLTNDCINLLSDIQKDSTELQDLTKFLLMREN